jgi:hypothetical protein
MWDSLAEPTKVLKSASQAEPHGLDDERDEEELLAV